MRAQATREMCTIGKKIVEMYNDHNLPPPPPCLAFADHVESLGSEYAYSTELVPEFRSAVYLKGQWSKLRGLYGTFYVKYTKSGHNEPDPTGYTEDLPTLLMHHT